MLIPNKLTTEQRDKLWAAVADYLKAGTVPVLHGGPRLQAAVLEVERVVGLFMAEAQEDGWVKGWEDRGEQIGGFLGERQAVATDA